MKNAGDTLIEHQSTQAKLARNLVVAIYYPLDLMFDFIRYLVYLVLYAIVRVLFNIRLRYE